MKRKIPETSLEAHARLNQDDVRLMYKKIAQALSERGASTSEELAAHLGEKHERVWKRLNEARELGICYRAGDKRKMASGRMGFLWRYGNSTDVVKNKEKPLKGKTVADFSRAILNQPKPSNNTINRLF